MKKNILTFLLIIFLVIVNHIYLRGEKSTCKVQCSSSKVPEEVNFHPDRVLPYYPPFIKI